MKKIIILIFISSPFFGYTQVKEFYIAPFPEGNDKTGNGSIGLPYATLHKTQEEVRSYIQNGMVNDVNIILKGGTYNLDQPLTLSNEDSGNNGFKIRYMSYNNEEVIISGGVKIPTNIWNVHEKGIWKANLNALGLNSIPTFRQMWVNGKKAQRARHEVVLKDKMSFITDYGHFWVNFEPDAKLNGAINNKTDLQVLTHWKWHSNWLIVDDITSSKITFNNKSKFTKRIQYKNENDEIVIKEDYHRIFAIENAYEFVDTPGEWFYNKYTKELFYYPFIGEAPDKIHVEIIIPILEKLITGNNVSNIEINGLTFSHATWLWPNKNGYFSGQATVYTEFDEASQSNIHHRDSPASIEFKESDNVVVSNCYFTHLGAVAISFEEHSVGNQISNSYFSDISGAAIRIGNGKNYRWRIADVAYATKDNLVTGNTIVNAANEYKSHPGIFLGYVQNTMVSYNTLSDLPYTGISIGYPVSKLENEEGTLLGSNTIKDNIITNVVHTLGDGGAIYNFGDSKNGQSSIINNQIYNIPSHYQDPYAPRAGIYLDEFSNNFYVANNSGSAFGYYNANTSNYDVENADIFLHIAGCDGKDNIFENNNFDGCNTHWVYRKEFKPEFHLTANCCNNDMGVRFVDVNNDGLKDMIYFRWINSSTKQKGVYLNNGYGWGSKLEESSPFVPPYHISADSYGDMGVQFVDIDGDGLEDMLYCRENYPDQCKAFKNTGEGWQYMPKYNPPKPHFNDAIGDLGVRYIDVNHDGYKDLIYFRWINATTQDKGVYLNNGNGWDEKLPDGNPHIPPYHISADAFGDMGVQFVDLNGDDKLDMIYWRWNPSQKGAYLNTPTGWQYAPNYLPKQPMFADNRGTLGVRFVDVDHNGLKDFIVYRVVSSNQIDRFVYLNRNNTWEYVDNCEYLPPFPISIDLEGDQGVRFVDLNNDGFEDLVQGYWKNGHFIKRAYFNNSRYLACNLENSSGRIWNDEQLSEQMFNINEERVSESDEISVYPNPFQTNLNVKFNLLQKEIINMKLFNSKGQLVKAYGTKSYEIGHHLIELDNQTLPNGLYVLKIETNSKLIQKKVIKITD